MATAVYRPAAGQRILNPKVSAIPHDMRPKATPLRANYNPAAYVYGGASHAVAKAIQTQGFKSAYKPGLAPLVQPPTAPPAAQPPPYTPSSASSEVQAASTGAPVGGAMPGEGVYAQDSAAAYDAYNAAVAAAEKDQQAARAQYGFNAEGTNLDPNSQTGIFQRIMHQQSQTSMNDAESALTRNLGGTGLGAQVAEQNDFQNQADLADTSQGYQALLAQALARKGDANTTLQNTLLQARQRQLETDLQNQQFTAWAQQVADLKDQSARQEAAYNDQLAALQAALANDAAASYATPGPTGLPFPIPIVPGGAYIPTDAGPQLAEISPTPYYNPVTKKTTTSLPAIYSRNLMA